LGRTQCGIAAPHLEFVASVVMSRGGRALAQRPKERDDVRCETIGLLECGEVTAARHRRIPIDP
jgi:hypothetical protein